MRVHNSPPIVAVLGASGLIGAAVAEGLLDEGFRVIAVARRFTAARAALFGGDAVTRPVGETSAADLSNLLRDRGADIVVNCLGVLQDGPRGRTADVHEAFVIRLLDAIQSQPKPVLLIHFSVPGREAEDATPFSQTKRAGERSIAAAGLPFVILRPGFVVASAAYDGSALVRALATLPIALPQKMETRPFAVVGAADIVRTVSIVVQRWASGEQRWRAVWDLCESRPATVGAVIEAFRIRFGAPTPLIRMPKWLLWAGARAGDMAAQLGWSPPIRTTALREMLRGVEGNPDDWAAATGIEADLPAAIRRIPTTVQERWFARLYLLKPLILVTLAVFWIASGTIALTVAFDAAAGILISHGFSTGLANLVTIATSLVDVAVGLAIAVRPSSRAGLAAGIAVSLFYVVSAALLTPDVWGEPLGGIVKTGPAIVLMMVALAILEDR